MTPSEAPLPEHAEPATRPPRGYTLVLPPGWARIPLRRGTDKAIRNILDRALSGFPRDAVATVRRDLQVRLREMAEQARQGGGLDLYVPTERRHDVTLAASLVVSEISLVTAQQVDPHTVLARLLADSDSTQAVELDDTAGTRTEHVAPATDSEPDLKQGSRRVDYVLPVPGDPERWLLTTFSTLGAGDPGDELADLLVELFDAMMTTFRWRRE